MLSSVLGLVPMALGWGEGAEIRSPMAVTVIGGLLFSTALTLIFIPVMYELLDRKRYAGDVILPAAVAPPGLKIALVKPVKQNNGLLIQGTVVNNSSQVLSIPAMQGTLKDANGQDLRRWVFNPPVRQLAPGQRTVFKTEVRPVPPGAARANVAFVGATTM